MSAAAARIAQEALRADVSIESLAKLAHADVAFAMKLLALVNSRGMGQAARRAPRPMPAFTIQSSATLADARAHQPVIVACSMTAGHNAMPCIP